MTFIDKVFLFSHAREIAARFYECEEKQREILRTKLFEIVTAAK